MNGRGESINKYQIKNSPSWCLRGSTRRGREIKIPPKYNLLRYCVTPPLTKRRNNKYNPFVCSIVIERETNSQITMEQSFLYTICGYVASIGLILGFLPQAITTIRTRNTSGISVPAFLLMAIGAFAFMLQGLLHRPGIIWSMFITNAITGTCSCIIFAIKVYNDYSKKSTKGG